MKNLINWREAVRDINIQGTGARAGTEEIYDYDACYNLSIGDGGEFASVKLKTINYLFFLSLIKCFYFICAETEKQKKAFDLA